jgi:hypothetical protein
LTTVNVNVTNQAAGNIQVAYNPAIFAGNVTNYGTVKNTNTTITWAALSSNRIKLFLRVSRPWRNRTLLTPQGEINTPLLRNSLAARSCPKAGYSSAVWTTAASISGATRFLKTYTTYLGLWIIYSYVPLTVKEGMFTNIRVGPTLFRALPQTICWRRLSSFM